MHVPILMLKPKKYVIERTKITTTLTMTLVRSTILISQYI